MIYPIVKKFHFYYFCYFNHWYKDGSPEITHTKLPVRQRTKFSIIIFPWILLSDVRLLVTYLFHLKPSTLFNGYLEIGLIFFFWYAYWQYFEKNERFREIYIQYKSTNSRIQDRVFANIRAVLILILFLSAIVFFFFWYSLSKSNAMG